MDHRQILQWIAFAVEALGVGIIVVGIAAASMEYLRQSRSAQAPYDPYRKSIGRSILLGLEVLVAGDIIQTVTVDTSFESVGVLAVIVVIRTFLSWSLEVELNGRWPWHASKASEESDE
jgi:uncharacterized membrane protein